MDGPEKTSNELLKKIKSSMAHLRMEVPSEITDPRMYKRFAVYQLIYSLCGLIIGLVCIIGGILLFLNGVVGSTSWTAIIVGAKSQISDAAPGTVLFIVGLFIVYITRFGVKVRK